MKKILVAVDGSENAKKATLKAKELGEFNDSEIILLYVSEDIMKSPYIENLEHKMAISEAFLERGNNVLKRSLNVFYGYKGKVRTLIKYGDPGKVIIKMAKEEECDLVVMGSRGLNAISRAMLGSVSNKVLNHIDISVLIVK